MEVLLAMRAESKADRNADKEEMSANTKTMLAAIKANEETTIRMDANRGP
jgi:hypothetical protein